MKYPEGIVKEKGIKNKTSNDKTTKINYTKRGMGLEDDLNVTNSYYREKDIAYIYKKPTPIKLVKVDYKIGKIKEAYFDMPSTTDYNGIYKGKYIDFEAKETTSLTSFPLGNIHSHQLKHLENIYRHKGVAFLIIRFTRLEETFILMEKDLLDFMKENKRKSIPISYMRKKGYKIKIKYQPRLDYLEALRKNGGI